MKKKIPRNTNRSCGHDNLNLNLELSLRPWRTDPPVDSSPVDNTVLQQRPEPPMQQQPQPNQVFDSIQQLFHNFIPPSFLQTQDQMQISHPCTSSVRSDLLSCPSQTQDKLQISHPFTSSVHHGDLPACPNQIEDHQRHVSHPFTSSVHSDLSAGPSNIQHSDLPAGPSHIQQSNSVGVSSSVQSTSRNGSLGPSRVRKNSKRAPAKQKSITITPPYPWATDRRAVVHSLSYLEANQISTITGDVKCKRCEKEYQIEYDLRTYFHEVAIYIAENKDVMHDRAPAPWTSPSTPTCKFCNQEKVVEPVIAKKSKNINWLFLLLGQTLGHLTLEQLKYLCKHTNNHRTGAKNRLLYLAYLALCKQLDPLGPFDP